MPWSWAETAEMVVWRSSDASSGVTRASMEALAGSGCFRLWSKSNLSTSVRRKKPEVYELSWWRNRGSAEGESSFVSARSESM